MNSVSGIINILTLDEKEAFVLFLKKKNKRSDTQNIQLFNLLKTDDINEEITIYKNKPALYALRKRLFQNLVEFIANKRFENDSSEERDVLKLILVSRTFFEHSQHKAAFKILEKAEVKALGIERFNLLNEVYHTYIQYAYLNPAIDFSALVRKYEINQQKFLQEEQLNLAYASLRLELAKIKDGNANVDFHQTLHHTFAKLSLSLEEMVTFKSLYQLLFIANEYAALRNKYHEIEPFVATSFRFINTKTELAEKHLFYHINILYFMANMLFRNKRFTDSKAYLDKMEVEMKKQDNVYFKQFENRLLLLRSLNENYSGNSPAAIRMLEDALNTTANNEVPEILDLQLSLAVFYFQQNELKKVQQIIKTLSHSDAWYEKKKGTEWAIKKNLVEILLHAELEHTDYVLSRLSSFKRRYQKQLTEMKEERVLVFLGLVERFLYEPGYLTSDELVSQADFLFQWRPQREEDLFVMSFYAWLKAKMEKRNVYAVTLELVSQN